MEFETSLISKLRQEIENIMPIDEKLLQRPDQVQKLERYYSLNLTHQTNIETDIKITCTPQMNEQKEKLNHQP
ncbi:hypothetical protein SAMN02746062_01247 [Alysiella filiformis DSM 16848]|uniref:Uncharacterized protein n=2 Tax=Alysiella TaxID=194195 RepID=A0A286EBU0_9NEIS|nr:hypothetical protein SAMN02746062_01247 [Alysiella filiformis DSM 16848]